MTSSASSPPTSPGLLDALFLGRLRWDLLRPFPTQDPADQQLGDKTADALKDLLLEHVDPEAVDRAGRLPEGLPQLLRRGGFLSLMVDPSLGGLGLSPANALRVIQTASSWCVAVGWMLAISNGFGPACYLPLVPEGPLRDLLLRHAEAGSLAGSADTEVNGAANRERATTAVPVEGGSAYLINGEKIFIGNGPLAALVDVSAKLEQDGADQIRIFFLETSSPGVEVVGQQEFMGIRGASIGVLRFNDVRVPAGQLLPTSVDEWRDEPALVRLAVLGRMLIIGAPSLAVPKLCLTWSKDFVNRRTMDGRPLGGYDEIQRQVAQTAADVFAIESITSWGMLSGDLAENAPELTAAKNLIAETCGRVVERTMSLMGGEGFETARSKAMRGAPQLPVERFARDARGLRIAGGVSFLLDYWTALSAFDTCYGESAGDSAEEPDAQPVDDPALSPRCREHLARVQTESRALADLCRRLVAEHGMEALSEQEHRLVLIGRIGITLLGMAVVLARAAHLAEQGNLVALELADISCTAAAEEISGLWPQLAEDTGPDYAGMSERVLHGDGLDFLLRDVITQLPAADRARAGAAGDD